MEAALPAGKGDEDLPFLSLEDVLAVQAHGSVRVDVLHDAQDRLARGRPHGNDHDALRRELTEELRRHVIDPAGDDDPVEWRVLRPAEIAVVDLAVDVA